MRATLGYSAPALPRLWQRGSRRRRRLSCARRLLVVTCVTTLTACGPTLTGGTDAACIALAPITFSAFDTDETVAQVRTHNAAWRAICDG